MREGEVLEGRYELHKELGKGGMGAVWRATDRKFSTQVAVKIAQPPTQALEEFRARFKREAQLGYTLGRQSGFVRAFDWGSCGKRGLFLAMDLVEGARSLDIKRGTLTERLNRLEEASRIVGEAHALQIVHRDLKPANFFVDAKGSIRLGDFGLAKQLGEAAEAEAPGTTDPMLTQVGIGMGTPQYMPPEQFEDAREVDVRVDVYALGVMLYRALCGGEYPYPGKTPHAVLAKQMQVLHGATDAPHPRQVDPRIPEPLDEVCARAIDLTPDRRYRDAKAFLIALRSARQDRSTSSRRHPSQAPTMAERRYEPPPAQDYEQDTQAPTSSAETNPYTASRLRRKQESKSERARRTSKAFTRGASSLNEARVRPRDTPDMTPSRRDQLEERLKSHMGPRRSVGIVGHLLSLLKLVVVLGAMGGAAWWFVLRPQPVEQESTVVDDLEEQAAAGDLDAMVELGRRYAAGDGVGASRPEAERWYQKAAEKGHTGAMIALGDLTGELKWYRQAAREGNKEAKRILREKVEARLDEVLDKQSSDEPSDR
jgi:eukaryotic-like serine/threonine-protein kinase